MTSVPIELCTLISLFQHEFMLILMIYFLFIISILHIYLNIILKCTVFHRISIIDHYVIPGLFLLRPTCITSMDELVLVRYVLNSGLPRIKFVIIIDHHNGSISIGGVDQFGDWQFFKSIFTKIIVETFCRLQSGIHRPKATSFGPIRSVDPCLQS